MVIVDFVVVIMDGTLKQDSGGCVVWKPATQQSDKSPIYISRFLRGL
jgi:hypothetical protein